MSSFLRWWCTCELNSPVLVLTLFSGLTFFTQRVEALNVSLATNLSTYISGDMHILTVGISNPGATAVTVDVYVAKMLPDGSLLFVTLPDLVTKTATFSPGTVNNQASWVPAITNLTLPAGMNLQGVNAFQQLVSDLDALGPYNWLMGLATPGTKNLISNLAVTPYIISSTANVLVGIWNGTWIDTVFNVTGTINMTITRTGNTLNVVWSNQGNQFPAANSNGTATGTITDAIGNAINAPFGAQIISNGQVTVNRRAVTVAGSATGFGPFTDNGTIIDGNRIMGTFNFTNPGAGAGTFNMTKV